MALPGNVPFTDGHDDWRTALMDVGIPYDIIADLDTRGGAGLGASADANNLGSDDVLCERLLERKAAAVEREDFAEAKRLKHVVARVREVADQAARLEECKRFAVLREARSEYSVALLLSLFFSTRARCAHTASTRRISTQQPRSNSSSIGSRGYARRSSGLATRRTAAVTATAVSVSVVAMVALTGCRRLRPTPPVRCTRSPRNMR